MNIWLGYFAWMSVSFAVLSATSDAIIHRILFGLVSVIAFAVLFKLMATSQEPQ